MQVNLWYVREGGKTAHAIAYLHASGVIATECGEQLFEWGQASRRNAKCKLCLSVLKRRGASILKPSEGPTELHGVTDKSPYTHFNDKGRDI